MNVFLGKSIIGYGLFLIVIGVLGFLSNPEKAKTALISGGGFGGLSIVWGILLLRGVRWARTAAVTTTLLLGAVFVWRALAGWLAVAGGQPEKRTAALLITVMLAGSLVMLFLLLRGAGRKGGAEKSSERPGAP